MSLDLFYKHATDNDLYWIRFDGRSWMHNGPILIQQPARGQPVHTPQSSDTPVTGVSPVNSNLLLFYKAAHSNNLMMSSFEGVSWSGDVIVQDPHGSIRPPRSDRRPGASVFRHHLFLIYKDEGSTDLCAAHMDSNGRWSWGVRIASLDGVSIAPKSDVAPSVVTYKDKLYVIYKGEGSHDLYLTIYDGTYWYGDVKISSQPGGIRPQSSSSPGLVVFNDLLFMIYKGPQNDDLNYAVFDGNAWHGNSEISKQPGGIRPQSGTNPGLAVFGGALVMSYRSPNNHDLNTARFDGPTWSGNSEISKQPGGLNPQASASPAAVNY